MGCSQGKFNTTAVDMTHFDFKKCLGIGGFGKVVGAIHKESGVQVAVKRMTKIKVRTKSVHLSAMMTERNLLATISSPFIVKMYFAWQDAWECFIVLPMMRGGSLQYHLETTFKDGFELEHTRFYAAQILLSINVLHEWKIVYRDLKPDNILFDDNGHMVLTDFGLAVHLQKKRNYKVRQRCGTPTFTAPEVLKKRSYDCVADYFGLGITVLHLAIGLKHNLFVSDDDVINNKPQTSTLSKIYDSDLKDMVTRLTAHKAGDRLGGGKGGVEEIKGHSFFAPLDWAKMLAREVDAPWKPNCEIVNSAGKHVARDMFMDDDPRDNPPETAEEAKKFVGFCYNTKYTEGQYTGVELKDVATKGRNQNCFNVAPTGAPAKVGPSLADRIKGEDFSLKSLHVDYKD